MSALPPKADIRSPAQKVYILHKKLSPHGALCAKPRQGVKRGEIAQKYPPGEYVTDADDAY